MILVLNVLGNEGILGKGTEILGTGQATLEYWEQEAWEPGASLRKLRSGLLEPEILYLECLDIYRAN